MEVKLMEWNTHQQGRLFEPSVKGFFQFCEHFRMCFKGVWYYMD